MRYSELEICSHFAVFSSHQFCHIVYGFMKYAVRFTVIPHFNLAKTNSRSS